MEAYTLSTRIGRKGTFFVWLSIVTSPVLAPVLAWGSECQPCSHTSCGTAKALHTPPHFAPTVRGREAFLTFFPKKRGEMSEFGVTTLYKLQSNRFYKNTQREKQHRRGEETEASLGYCWPSLSLHHNS